MDVSPLEEKQEMGVKVESLSIPEYVWMLLDYSWFAIEVKGELKVADERIEKAEQIGVECSEEVKAAMKNAKGEFYRRTGNTKKSFVLFAEAISIEGGEGKNHCLATYYNTTGISFEKNKDFENAKKSYKKSLELILDLETSEGFPEELYIEYGNVLDNYGGYLLSLGEIDLAFKMLLEALFVRKKVYGEENSLVADSHYNIGVCYKQVKKYSAAAKHHKKALNIREKLYQGEGEGSSGSLKATMSEIWNSKILRSLSCLKKILEFQGGNEEEIITILAKEIGILEERKREEDTETLTMMRNELEKLRRNGHLNVFNTLL